MSRLHREQAVQLYRTYLKMACCNSVWENQGEGQPACQGLGSPGLSVAPLAAAAASLWRPGVLGETERLGFPLLLAPLRLSTPTPSLHSAVGEELENPLTHSKSWEKPGTEWKSPGGKGIGQRGKTCTWSRGGERRLDLVWLWEGGVADSKRRV